MPKGRWGEKAAGKPLIDTSRFGRKDRRGKTIKRPPHRWRKCAQCDEPFRNILVPDSKFCTSACRREFHGEESEISDE